MEEGEYTKGGGVRVFQRIPDHSPHNTTSHIPPKQSRIYAGTSNLFAVVKRIHAYITMLSSGHTEGLYNCVSYCGNGINTATSLHAIPRRPTDITRTFFLFTRFPLSLLCAFPSTSFSKPMNPSPFPPFIHLSSQTTKPTKHFHPFHSIP